MKTYVFSVDNFLGTRRLNHQTGSFASRVIPGTRTLLGTFLLVSMMLFSGCDDAPPIPDDIPLPVEAAKSDSQSKTTEPRVALEFE